MSTSDLNYRAFFLLECRWSWAVCGGQIVTADESCVCKHCGTTQNTLHYPRSVWCIEPFINDTEGEWSLCHNS